MKKMEKMTQRDKRLPVALSIALASVLSAAFILTSLYRTFAADFRAERGKASAVTSAEPAATAASPSRTAVNSASLSSQKVCWGLGAHYDDQGRPTDALTAQEKYGALGGRFIDPSGEKTLYLTFDEGYENGYTSKILDTLKEKNVKATFFITGDYAKRQGDLVQRMIDEGHTVGNHTWRHYSMPEKSAEVCREELTELQNYVEENFHYRMTTLRPPKGEFSEQTLALASEMGYTTWLWSFAYMDWNPDAPGSPEASLQKLNDRLHPGGIYLLHAVSPTNAKILGQFIDGAQSKGYRFVLPE